MNRDPLQHTEAAWRRLVATARATLASRESDRAHSEPPFGFATRVLARVRQAREADQRFALWQRLAWRSALASLLVSGLLFLGQRASTDAEPILSPPTLDWTIR